MDREHGQTLNVVPDEVISDLETLSVRVPRIVIEDLPVELLLKIFRHAATSPSPILVMPWLWEYLPAAELQYCRASPTQSWELEEFPTERFVIDNLYRTCKLFHKVLQNHKEYNNNMIFYQKNVFQFRPRLISPGMGLRPEDIPPTPFRAIRRIYIADKCMTCYLLLNLKPLSNFKFLETVEIGINVQAQNHNKQMYFAGSERRYMDHWEYVLCYLGAVLEVVTRDVALHPESRVNMKPKGFQIVPRFKVSYNEEKMEVCRLAFKEFTHRIRELIIEPSS